jgi:TolA-binding protein
MTDSIWKWIAVSLATVVMALAGSYAALARSAVTSDDVSRQIVAESPYTRDQAALAVRLDLQAEQLSRLEKKVDRLTEVVISLRAR